MTAPTGLTPATPANSGPISVGGNFGPVLPSVDPLEALPKRAAEKLRQLRQRSEDAHSIIPIFEDIREANTARHDAERALRRLTDHRSLGGFELDDDDGRTIATRKTLDKATAEARRLTKLSEVRSAAWQNASAALQSVERWISERPAGMVLRDIDAEVPTFDKGESLSDAIERHRKRVRELRADLHRIEHAPLPSAYAKQRARVEIAQLAQRGAVGIGRLMRGGDREFPSMTVRSLVHNIDAAGAATIHEAVDTLAVFVWLHSEQLLQKLDAEIDKVDHTNSLSPEEKQRQEAAVRSSLLELERAECALTWRAMSENLPIEFRGDCSPLAILSVELVGATPVNERGSSWQHALGIVGAGR